MAIWQGGKYYRKKSKSWRDSNNGVVYDSLGRPIGREKENSHFSGFDPKKLKKKPTRKFKPKPIRRTRK